MKLHYWIKAYTVLCVINTFALLQGYDGHYREISAIFNLQKVILDNIMAIFVFNQKSVNCYGSYGQHIILSFIYLKGIFNNAVCLLHRIW